MATEKPSEQAAESESAPKASSKSRSSAKPAGTAVPTEGVPGFMRPVYNTGAGKRAYEIASEPALFLRYGVVGVAALGLFYTLFNVLSVRGAGVSTILSTLFFSLLVTLVATGILYALRTVVEQTGSRE